MSVERWRSRIGGATFRNNLTALRLFMRYLRDGDSRFKDFSEDQLIEYQRQNSGSYEILDQLQGFVIKTGARDSYKRRNLSSIKSFFAHNRAPLPQDLDYSFRPSKQPVRGTLSAEDLKTLLAGCNILYRAVFLSMFQAGMGCGELLYWSDHGLGDLKSQLEQESRLIKVDLPGRKKNKNKMPYHTYIGLDGREALKAWMRERPKVGSSIFVNVRGQRITEYNMRNYWLQHLAKAGLITPDPQGHEGTRYGKNLHEMRDLFRTRWEKSGTSGTAAEFFLGHGVDPLEYNKAYRDEDFTKGLYLQAEPWLNILSGDPSKVPKVEVESLRRELEETKTIQGGKVAELEAKLEENDIKHKADLSEIKKMLGLVLANPELAEKVKQLMSKNI